MLAVYLRQPLTGRVPSDELNFSEERAKLAHGAFNVVRQRLDFVPGDVRRGRPLALNSLFVEETRIVGVHIRSADIGAGDARRLRPRVRTTDADRAVVGLLGYGTGGADFDLVEGEAALARLGAQAVGMAVVQVEPAEV